MTRFTKINIQTPSITDPFDRRFFHGLTNDLSAARLVILGYPDDEGIRNNHGRPGAAQAPQFIRKWLYRMTPSGSLTASFDGGDLNVADSANLSLRLEWARAEAARYLNAGKSVLTLGGGHDFGFSDGAAYFDWCQVNGVSNPMIINLDAHLDVRPMGDQPHSGFAFRRLLEMNPKATLLEVGVGEHCASPAHVEWVRRNGGDVLHLGQISTGSRGITDITAFLDRHLKEPRDIFLSLDIDVLSSCFAPGASQSWPLGLDVSVLHRTLVHIFKNTRTRIFGIYEVSPPLDLQEQTSKAAALMAYAFWTHLGTLDG